MKKILNFLILAVFLLSVDVYAGVILNVRAVNPLDEVVTEVIRYDLPISIKSEHIKGFRVEGEQKEIEIVGEGLAPSLEQESKISVELAGEDVDSFRYKILFDEEKDIYFIEVKVRFPPKGVVSLTIDLEDVWNISSDRIEALRSIVPDVSEEDFSSFSLREMIFQQLGEIVERQEKSSVEQVGVKEHIEIYKKNKELLDQVENDIAMLEGLLLED